MRLIVGIRSWNRNLRRRLNEVMRRERINEPRRILPAGILLRFNCSLPGTDMATDRTSKYSADLAFVASVWRIGCGLAQQVDPDEQWRDAADDKAEAVAAGEAEESRIRERSDQRAHLTKGEHAAGHRAAHAFRRRARCFSQ